MASRAPTLSDVDGARALRAPQGRAVTALLAAAVALAVTGCAFDSPEGRALPSMAALQLSPEPYKIRVGDALDVRFYKTPELNVDKVPVRHDGKISLELVGDIQAAGLATEELSAALAQAYSQELEDPRIAVIIREFGGQIFVGGEVGRPAAVKYVDGMTVLGAIQSAGGFNEDASRQNVVLLRRAGDRYEGYRLYVESALSGDDYTQDVGLRPDDVVFVPKSRIANLNQVVEQYITNNLPVPLALPAL